MSPILQGLANGSVRGYGGYLPLGPSGAFESIASATGTGSSGTITFSSIPQTFQSLHIRVLFRPSTADAIFMRINGSSSTVYTYHQLAGDGSTALSYGAGTQDKIYLDSYNYPSSTMPQAMIINIENYTSTTQNKTVRCLTGTDLNSSGGIALSSGLYRSTTAVTSLTLNVAGSNFDTSSTFALYGIKGA